ncbi:MAG: lytic transglycosylase domain-containing protein [Clostridia bacterium]|nr:lytic transglycosylase domain-containing protein [Clostridia bacterium]MBR3716132.1 lytic transglycosylase domain-containing protein [Clostridia bacterium]
MKSKLEKKLNGALVSFSFILLALLVGIVFVVAIALIEEVPEVPEDVEEITYPIKYKEEIEEASDEFGVPKEAICAVIYAESRFNANAKSAVGARGLMQIMPSTFKDIQKALGTDYSDDDLYDPKVNIRAGTYYLSYLYKLLGDWELVHAAYNAGIGNVWSWLDDDRYSKDGKLTDIPFSETKNYVKKVALAKEKYKELYFSK